LAKKKTGSCLYVVYPVIKGKKKVDMSIRKSFSTKEKALNWIKGNPGLLSIEPCDTETLRSLQALEASRGEY
jgi:hypothetical protein